MHDYLNFSNKVVLVTGSTRNIGKAIARLFAEQGATVVINSRHQEDVDRTVEEFKREGLKALGIVADVGNWQEAKIMISQIDQDYGRLDAVINNAAIRGGGDLESLEEKDWQEMLRTNVLGIFHTTKAVVPIMKRQKSGAVVNVSSRAAFSKFKEISSDHTGLNYAVSKGVAVSLTRYLALNLNEWNIRVNAIMPVLVKTYDERQKIDQAHYEVTKNFSPLKRLTVSEDIAMISLFLASDLASYVTGETISVGGPLPRPNIVL